MEIDQRVAVLTGAAGHLGRAIGQRLAADGARIAALDADADGLTEAAAAMDAAMAIDCDLTDEHAVDAALERITEALGPVHVLVNAVGLIHNEPVASMFGGRHGLESWHRVIGANLTAPFVIGAAVAQQMLRKRTRGVLVNVGSVNAKGVAGQSAYSAAKAGLNGMTRAWAAELGSAGIRAVAVAPGFIDVPSTHEALGESGVEQWRRETPLRRLGTTDEVVSAVRYAIENDFVTGTVLEVDGGV